MRNITKPRKASIDVTRVTAGEIAGACVTGRGATGSVATLLMMVAFYAWSPDSEPAPDCRQPNAEPRAPRPRQHSGLHSAEPLSIVSERRVVRRTLRPEGPIAKCNPSSFLYSRAASAPRCGATHGGLSPSARF